MTDALSVREKLNGQLESMATDLEQLVNQETSSHDLDDLNRAADLLHAQGQRIMGFPPERVVVDGKTQLVWSKGTPKVGLYCHYDTVWPTGTLKRWPYSRDGFRATGPGVFDMKSGIIESFYTLAALGFPDGVVLLVTADEEIGSHTSRPLIEKYAQDLTAALILEGSHHGHIKVGRKGVSHYELEIVGRAAHAGLEPEKGINALIELAPQVLAVTELANEALGTTVTPTVAHSGSTENVVPATAHLTIDVRARTRDEQERVDRAMNALKAVTPGAKLKMVGDMNRPPFQRTMAMELFEHAQNVAKELAIDIEGIEVGGGSDGNFTSAVGTRTLDGLGAVGDEAHAEGEWIDLQSIPERGALVAGLILRLLS